MSNYPTSHRTTTVTAEGPSWTLEIPAINGCCLPRRTSEARSTRWGCQCPASVGDMREQYGYAVKTADPCPLASGATRLRCVLKKVPFVHFSFPAASTLESLEQSSLTITQDDHSHFHNPHPQHHHHLTGVNKRNNHCSREPIHDVDRRNVLKLLSNTIVITINPSPRLKSSQLHLALSAKAPKR